MNDSDMSKFIINSYFLKDYYNVNMSTWELSPVFMMMAGLYQLDVCGKDLSFENLNNPDSDIHKYIAKCSILNMVSMLAGTITINDYVPLKHPSYFFTVDVNNISHEDTTGHLTKWDYRISFPREALPSAADPISIYEYRHCLNGIFEKSAVPLADSFRRNVWTELAEKGFGSIKDKAIGFLELTGVLSGAKSLIGFGFETALLFDEVTQNNKKVDNLVELIMNRSLYDSLHIGGSVSTTQDGKWILNVAAIDTSMLSMSLRARELKTGITIGMSADEIEQKFKDGTLDASVLADYTSWYGSWGEQYNAFYKDALLKASKSAYMKQNGLEFLSEDQIDALNDKATNLSYEQMKELEKHFPENWDAVKR